MGGPGSGRRPGGARHLKSTHSKRVTHTRKVKYRHVPYPLMKKDTKKLSKKGMYAH